MGNRKNIDKDLLWAIELFNEKIKSRDKDLLKQAREYERRLESLNHENARILAAQDKSVSVEKFDGTVSQIFQKMENTIGDLRKDMIDLKEFKQKQEGKGQGGKDIIEIIKLIIIVAGFFIAYFVIKK